MHALGAKIEQVELYGGKARIAPASHHNLFCIVAHGADVVCVVFVRCRRLIRLFAQQVGDIKSQIKHILAKTSEAFLLYKEAKAIQ